jgi:preprotein translocase subunit YajC
MQSILLLAQPSGGEQSGGGYSMLIFLGLMILVFYFFMIRPQQKKQKQIQKFRESIKKGDKIVTIGGIHGKIVDVQDTTFTIEISDNVKVTIEKAAVAIDGNDAKKQ